MYSNNLLRSYMANEKIMNKIIIASSLGTVFFEWYDFYLMVMLAVFLVPCFFPKEMKLRVFWQVLTFGAGFAVRPLSYYIWFDGDLFYENIHF